MTTKEFVKMEFAQAALQSCYGVCKIGAQTDEQIAASCWDMADAMVTEYERRGGIYQNKNIPENVAVPNV